jgi:cell division protein FtsW
MTAFDRSRRDIFSKWWWTVDRVMCLAILLLMSFGMMMVVTASPAIAERIGVDSFYFVKRQLVFLFLGIFCMLGVSLLPVVAIRRLGIIGFLGCLVLMAGVLVIGEEVNGAKRWLSIGGFSLQPSEFGKPFFIIVTAWLLSFEKSWKNIGAFKCATIMYGIFVLLLVTQPDFGMTVVVTAVWACQMFLAGLSLFWVGIFIVLGIVGILSAYTFLPHVASRINTFLDGGNTKNAASYQVQKSLEAFYSGGITGRGPGEGMVKLKLPDSHTDFIFAVVGEELGALACIIVVLLFGFIVMRGLKRVLHETDSFVVYSVAGLLTQFGLQAMINMGVAVHILPAKGMTLPFVSYGGSSVIALCIEMGMVLALTRRRYGVIFNKAKVVTKIKTSKVNV